ncbi:MAG: NTP transferase domain-containing protein [Muribaculaceae bacterium]|nr:NTP transferase domain-containing protein [Muribaculaceae bacterium]
MNYAIIAAGEGSRLVQEGVALPKPLVELDGRPMIRRLIDIFIANNAETISVIVNEQMTQVREYLEKISRELPCGFSLVVKSTPSSMHSFYEVSRIFPEGSKFILTTVDTIFKPDDFGRYADAFEKADDSIDGVMGVTTFIDDEKPLYVETAPSSNHIIGYKDNPYPGAKYISAGIYGLKTNALNILEECFKSGVSRMRNYQRALVSGGLYLEAFDLGKVIDVDHADDIITAQKFLGIG